MGRMRDESDRENLSKSTVKLTVYAWEVVIEHFEALSQQRRRETVSEYHRLATYIGSLFLSLEGEPGPDGKYGLFTPEELWTRIRPYIVLANEWLAEQGHPIQAPQAALFPPEIVAAFTDLLLGRGLPQRGPTSPESVGTARKNGHSRDDSSTTGEEVVPEFDLDSMNLE